MDSCNYKEVISILKRERVSNPHLNDNKKSPEIISLSDKDIIKTIPTKTKKREFKRVKNKGSGK